jgi:hypothetical protein
MRDLSTLDLLPEALEEAFFFDFAFARGMTSSVYHDQYHGKITCATYWMAACGL